MTIGHDRFESLAGAMWLGEATDAERDEFVTHARRCPVCATDLAEMSDGDGGAQRPAPLAIVRSARDDESWRPDIATGFVARVRARREGRAKLIFGALGGATVLSLAANFVVVTGLGSRIDSALHPQPLVGIVREAPFFAKTHALVSPSLAAAHAEARRLAARERAARLALAKHVSASGLADVVSDPVDSHSSARKLIPTDGVIVADPLAGTPLDAALAKSHDRVTRNVAVDPGELTRETLRR